MERINIKKLVYIIFLLSSLLLYGSPSTIKPRAKAVIQIWLWGGPSHLDTFDPKPTAGYDYCGQFDKTIQTNVPGIEINAMLPNLATIADKYSIIRSMTHGINSHETAAYIMQTGHPSEERIVYPSIGAVVSLFKGYDYGYKGVIPPYVILTESQGRFSEVGFLGSKYKPFITGGDPNRQPFTVEGIVLEGISEQRQKYRAELLEVIDSLERYIPGNQEFIRLNKCREQAWKMIEEGKKLFDLSQEPEEVRERYGKNTFGQACLVARRLVENGVVYVTINYKGWDTHSQHFQAMRQKLPELDKGLVALIQDLSERGLLDTTIVWVSGEFGRTPKISWEPPWNGGRGHYGDCFSVLVAGGGFKGGCVVGSSDEKGEYVKERPVYPQNLLGSIYYLLGIDPEGIFPDQQGRNLRILPPIEKGEGKGLLWEIMDIRN